MALRPHLQNYLRMVSIYAIAISLSPLAFASKKITTLMKRCFQGVIIGNATLQHLHLGPYNCYYHCEEFCIRRGELFAKCFH